MTFLVTGATGFIGSYLIQRIAREGHVVVCVAISPDHTGLSDKLGVDVMPCDVGDQEQVAALFRNVPPVNRVVHLAYVMGAESEADPSLAMRVNALGAANLFGAACETGVQRIIFLSSESVYGPQSVYCERAVRDDDYRGPADHHLT